MMIACCIDIPENDEEAERLAKQNFSDLAENAYMGVKSNVDMPKMWS